MSEASLPGTAIEWYMFGAVLVGLNIVVLLATGHTLPESFAMGLFYGLGFATVFVILIAVWSMVRGADTDRPEQ